MRERVPREVSARHTQHKGDLILWSVRQIGVGVVWGSAKTAAVASKETPAGFFLCFLQEWIFKEKGGKSMIG